MLPCQNGNNLRTRTTNIVKNAGEKILLCAAGIKIISSVILKIRIEVHQNLRVDLSYNSIVSLRVI